VILMVQEIFMLHPVQNPTISRLLQELSNDFGWQTGRSSIKV